MLRTSLIALAAAALASVGVAQQVRFYQDGRPERIFRPVSGVDSQDVTFLQLAAMGNNFEIQASRIALQNGSGAFVQQYAKEMITDHQAAQNEILQTAERRGVPLNGELPKEMQTKLNQLRNMKGSDFNSSYKDIQAKGHQASIQIYKHEIVNGHDQLIKGTAVKQLPTIELHYKMLLGRKTQMGETQMGHGM